jgi:hypothetical protein
MHVVVAALEFDSHCPLGTKKQAEMLQMAQFDPRTLQIKLAFAWIFSRKSEKKSSHRG